MIDGDELTTGGSAQPVRRRLALSLVELAELIVLLLVVGQAARIVAAILDGFGSSDAGSFGGSLELGAHIIAFADAGDASGALLLLLTAGSLWWLYRLAGPDLPADVEDASGPGHQADDDVWLHVLRGSAVTRLAGLVTAATVLSTIAWGVGEVVYESSFTSLRAAGAGTFGAAYLALEAAAVLVIWRVNSGWIEAILAMPEEEEEERPGSHPLSGPGPVDVSRPDT